MIEDIIKELSCIAKHLSDPAIKMNQDYSRKQINAYLKGHDDACYMATELIENLIIWIRSKHKQEGSKEEPCA